MNSFEDLLIKENNLKRKGFSAREIAIAIREDIISILVNPRIYSKEEQDFILKNDYYHQIWQLNIITEKLSYDQNLFNMNKILILPSNIYKNGIIITFRQNNFISEIHRIFFLKEVKDQMRSLVISNKYWFHIKEMSVLKIAKSLNMYEEFYNYKINHLTNYKKLSNNYYSEQINLYQEILKTGFKDDDLHMSIKHDGIQIPWVK